MVKCCRYYLIAERAFIKDSHRGRTSRWIDQKLYQMGCKNCTFLEKLPKRYASKAKLKIAPVKFSRRELHLGNFVVKYRGWNLLHGRTEAEAR